MKKSVTTPGNQGTVRDNSSGAQVVTHGAKCARCKARPVTTKDWIFCNVCAADMQKQIEQSTESGKDVFARLERNHRDEWAR